jgi:hypothetical protein
MTAGFTITAWNDVTMEALKWIGQQRPLTQGFSLGVVMGSRLGEMSANLARNIREGRVRFVMGVCTPDGAGWVVGDRKGGATGEQEAAGG